jgi:hypothetical protein
MNVNTLEQWFEIGGRELGVRVLLRPKIPLSNDIQLEPTAWLPDFGGGKGTLIFEGSLNYRNLALFVRDAGYTASTMGSVTKEFAFDVQEFAGMLSEWGWSSDGPQPEWLNRYS